MWKYLKMRPMQPAVTSIFCCSVFVAAGVVAVYALVSYTIAFAYELLWILESDPGLPAPAYFLAICYFGTMVATSVLIHGLATDNLRCILSWLITVILILIPECCLVFYMSISHWGLQSIYGMTELIFYLVRLLAIVIGIVIVQSYYATKLIHVQRMKQSLNGQIANNLQPTLTESEFNASGFVPGADIVDSPSLFAYTNYGMIREQSKFAHSMPDLRDEFIRSAPSDFHGQMSKYWQPGGDEPPIPYDSPFAECLPPNYVFPHYTRSLDRRCRKNDRRRRSSGSLVELRHISEENRRNMYSSYGNNLLEDMKHDVRHDRGMRDFGPPMLGPDDLLYRRHLDSRYGSSKTSMGNESDDLTKYRDVAL